MNDYVLEKTFVYGIVALSKWLGAGRFPQGVYGQWPPKMPAELVPRNHGSESFDVDPTVPSQVPSLVGHQGDVDLPAHLSIGGSASSSSMLG